MNEVRIPQDIYSNLEAIVYLHRRHGAPNPQETVEGLVNYVLESVVVGFERSGSWERQMFESMGLVPND